jgi:hypothetical protein
MPMTKPRSAPARKVTAKRFASAIYWTGVALVSFFLLWAIAMVLWQAADRLHR